MFYNNVIFNNILEFCPVTPIQTLLDYTHRIQQNLIPKSLFIKCENVKFNTLNVTRLYSKLCYFLTTLTRGYHYKHRNLRRNPEIMSDFQVGGL